MMSVSGVKEIDKVLKGLPKQLQHRVLVSAHIMAARPFVQAAKALAPEKSGRLKKNIGSSGVPQKKANVVGETLSGQKSRGWVGRFIERGTEKRATKGKGKKKKYGPGANRGQVTAKPYLEPAFNQTKTIIINRINESVGKTLFSFMNRTIKRK
jgi:HK97 gp10 family phage protein